MKYCKKCDTKNPDQAAKCLVCGSTVFVTEEQKKKEENEAEKALLELLGVKK